MQWWRWARLWRSFKAPARRCKLSSHNVLQPPLISMFPMIFPPLQASLQLSAISWLQSNNMIALAIPPLSLKFRITRFLIIPIKHACDEITKLAICLYHLYHLTTNRGTKAFLRTSIFSLFQQPIPEVGDLNRVTLKEFHSGPKLEERRNQHFNHVLENQVEIRRLCNNRTKLNGGIHK
jgi:hypothetical protein